MSALTVDTLPRFLRREDLKNSDWQYANRNLVLQTNSWFREYLTRIGVVRFGPNQVNEVFGSSSSYVKIRGYETVFDFRGIPPMENTESLEMTLGLVFKPGEHPRSGEILRKVGDSVLNVLNGARKAKRHKLYEHIFGNGNPADSVEFSLDNIELISPSDGTHTKHFGVKVNAKKLRLLFDDHEFLSDNFFKFIRYAFFTPSLSVLREYREKPKF